MRPMRHFPSEGGCLTVHANWSYTFPPFALVYV